MRGRYAWLLAGAAVLAAALLVPRLGASAPPRALGPEVGASTTGGVGPVGHRVNVFLGPFHARGADDVRVRAVRLTDVPPGMRVVGIHGVVGRNAGYSHGRLDPAIYDLRPVGDMVFRPGEPERWGLVVIVEGAEVGYWVTTGLDVDWQAGTRTGTTHYEYRVSLRVRP